MQVNQPPVAPYHNPAVDPVPPLTHVLDCRVYPATGKALLDTFTIECNDWTDPDNIGIDNYKVESESIVTGQ